MSKNKQKYLTFVMCISVMLAAIVGLIVPNVHAASNGELKLICVNEDIPLSGMQWKIYRVAEITKNGYVLSGDFGRYHVDLIDMSKENISAAAQTLESYAIADKKNPLATASADSSGTVVFQGLKKGLYLALGSLYEAEPFYYDPAPILVEVGDGTESAYPKISRATLTDEVSSYTVRKVWLDNDDSFEVRPVYVTVDVYKDGELFDTVTLNEENNWQYRWESENKLTEWLVIEREIPTEYEVRIEYNEKQYLIRNRHISVKKWDDVIETTAPISGTTVTTYTTTVTETATGTATGSRPDTDGKITSSSSSVSSTSSTSATKNNVNTTTQKQSASSGGKLPQTGQLWWPIIPLVFGGAILIVLGFILRPKKDNK